MARDLKSLVGAGSARELQEKLESWHQDYEMNSSGENMSRCCELLELNSAIQKQLFSILNETSQEDECAAVKRCRPPPCCTASGGQSLSQDSAGGELQLRDLACNPKCRLRELEDKLAETRVELTQMEQDLKASHAGECKTLRKLQQLNDYEQQLQLLQDEISILDCQKSVLQSRLAQSCCPPPCGASKPCCGASKPCCVASKPCCVPVSPCCATQCRRASASRRACLIARFNFVYAKDRLDAEVLLKKFVCDTEIVQRIIYITVLEAFRAAKKAFWKIKMSVKETLAIDHCGGPASLEMAALDYIACHKDLFDVCCSVQEVICCMNVNPKLPCPSDIDFNVINGFIRELCCLAFQMQTLAPPLDVAFGIDGELFNRSMYYRSCDSDFSAPFVAYHIWPALMENGAVIVKGEVVTRKMVQCYRRSRTRSRSCCCDRRLLPGQVTRSRSLSTVRFKTSGR